ncbi:MAG: phytanoyl-CoA dioxygenase family protein [Hyphomicrobiales bacterium]|nr:MAG: phytanoyl-CoA dioxygenase family protein [Hyphomicrobiales bacterium]
MGGTKPGSSSETADLQSSKDLREDRPVSFQLQQDDIRKYQDDGVVCLRGVIDRDLCERMLDATIDFADNGEGDKHDFPEDSGGRYFFGIDMNKTVPAFHEFAFDTVLPKVAGGLMQSKAVRFFYDQVFLVEPGTKRATPWHNDLAYWPFDGGDIVSLWVALTDVTSESSPLQYLAGSHRDGKMYRAVGPGDSDGPVDTTFERSPDYSDPANQEGKRILSWEMRPGDVLAHHPLALHGSHANRTKGQRRCGLSLRYLGDDVRYNPSDRLRERNYNVPAGAYPADDANLPPIAI